MVVIAYQQEAILLAVVNLLNHILLFHLWNAIMLFKMCSETYGNGITVLNPCNLFGSYA